MLKVLKAAGRPAGEKSLVVPVRIPVTLVERLDRYMDKIEAETGVNASRGMIMRSALKAFLDSKKH